MEVKEDSAAAQNGYTPPLKLIGLLHPGSLSIIWTIYTDTMPTMTNTDDLGGRLSICSQDQIEVLIDSHQTKQECGDNGVLDSSTR